MDFSEVLVCHSRYLAEMNCSNLIFVAICLRLTPKLKYIAWTNMWLKLTSSPKQDPSELEHRANTVIPLSLSPSTDTSAAPSLQFTRSLLGEKTFS